MTSDKLSNKKLEPIVTKLIITGGKWNTSIVFTQLSITKSYFAVTKTIRLNTTHYFVMKSLNNREVDLI